MNEPITYGIRRRGMKAVIGVVPAKVHAAPPTSKEYSDVYEEIPLYDQAIVDSLERSLNFYRQRCEALQAIQARMRDPERKAVCDILANGSTSALGAKA